MLGVHGAGRDFTVMTQETFKLYYLQLLDL